MSRDYPVLIGAAGWSHPAWLGGYYPDDLPAEWQPVYYANEFPVVLIPAADLAQADAATLATWREAGETGLRLIVELDAEGRLAARARQLGEALAGLVLPATGTADLASRLDALGRTQPVVVDFGQTPPPAETGAWLARRDTGWCWHGAGPTTGLEPGELALMRVPSAAADPRSLRHWLEAGLAVQDGQRTVALILEGAPPEVDLLRQAQTLSELL